MARRALFERAPGGECKQSFIAPGMFTDQHDKKETTMTAVLLIGWVILIAASYKGAELILKKPICCNPRPGLTHRFNARTACIHN